MTKDCKIHLPEVIESFCETHENCRYYENYSGRWLFDCTCPAIVTDEDPFFIIMRLCDHIRNRYGAHCSFKEILGPVRTDSLGLSKVIYFPDGMK